MRIDVHARCEKERWHWDIIGPLDDHAGAAGVVASCCDIKGGNCNGYIEMTDAEIAGWDYGKKHGMT